MQHALHISFEVEVQTGTKVFRLPKLPCTVGRARWAGVRLKHLSVLESHATVQLVDGKVVMTPDDPQQPLRTTAGPSNWIVLTDGMKVYVGEVPLRVRFTIGSTSDPAATTAPKAAMPTRPESVQPPAAPSGAPVPIAAPMAVPGPVARPATVLAEPFPTRGVVSASVPPPAPVNSRQPSVQPQPTTALNSASVPQPTTTSPVFSHVPSPTPAGMQAPQPIDSWAGTQASPMPSHVAHGAWNHSALPAPQNRSTLAGPAQTSAVPFTAYRPSGAIPNTWPIIAAMGVAGAFVVGGIYGWVNYYFPVVGVVTLFIAAGASYLTGMAISAGIKGFHLRNPIMAAAIGGASGLLLIPFAWLSFLTVLYWSRIGAPLVRTWFQFASSPIDVVRTAYELFSDGWTSIGHTNISGFPLLAGWLIEAGCFIGFATYVAWQAARKPFDEQLGTWHSPQPFGTAFALPGEDPASIMHFPAERLPELVPSSPESPHLLLTFYESGTEGTAPVGTLPLVAIDRVVFKDKKADKVRVMEPHYIPPEIVQHLRTFHTFVAPM